VYWHCKTCIGTDISNVSEQLLTGTHTNHMAKQLIINTVHLTTSIF